MDEQTSGDSHLAGTAVDQDVLHAQVVAAMRDALKAINDVVRRDTRPGFSAPVCTNTELAMRSLDDLESMWRGRGADGAVAKDSMTGMVSGK